MNTARKVGVILWIVVALVLVGAMVAGIVIGPQFLTNRVVFYSGSGLNDENTEILGEYSVATKDVEKVDLNWKSGLIRIGTHSGDDIKLIERVLKNSKEYNKMTYEVEAGVLNIDGNMESKWSFFNFGPNTEQKIIDLKLPQDKPELLKDMIINAESADINADSLSVENLQAELSSGNVKVEKSKINSCNISVTSGNITVDEVEAYSGKEILLIKTKSTSGDVKVYGCEAKTVDVESTSGNSTCKKVTAVDSIQVRSTSGNIDVSDCNTENLGLSVTSGNINTKSVVANQAKANLSSGDIELNIDAEKIECHATSGNIIVNGNIYNADMKASSGSILVNSYVDLKEANFSIVSGDMSLFMPLKDKNGFTANYDTVSGELDSDLEFTSSTKNDSKYVYGNGKYSYSFKSTSGDLKINSNDIME